MLIRPKEQRYYLGNQWLVQCLARVKVGLIASACFSSYILVPDLNFTFLSIPCLFHSIMSACQYGILTNRAVDNLFLSPENHYSLIGTLFVWVLENPWVSLCHQVCLMAFAMGP